jgi:hypothetical protein
VFVSAGRSEQAELAEYYRLIAALEAQQSAARGAGGSLTLRRLLVWSFEPRQRFCTMAVLVDVATQPAGAAGLKGGALASVRPPPPSSPPHAAVLHPLHPLHLCAGDGALGVHHRRASRENAVRDLTPQRPPPRWVGRPSTHSRGTVTPPCGASSRAWCSACPCRSSMACGDGSTRGSSTTPSRVRRAILIRPHSDQRRLRSA